jgi:hypothetical protein
MRTTRQNRAATVLPLVALLLVGGLTLGCDKKEADAPAGPNDERWTKFENANKQEVSNAMSAYEKRQAQLAAKKKGGDVKATPTPAAK